MLIYLYLILGFILLIKGADFFVDGASDAAKRLRIPSIIIGLTIVAMGTSLPETSVSITAAMQGKNELSLSNVVGSNIFNLLIVAGASALIRPISVQPSVLKKDFPFSIIITAFTLLLCIPTVYHGEKTSVLTNIEGIFLLILFAGYLITIVRDAKKARNSEECTTVQDTRSVFVIILYLVCGSAAVIWGGNLVVDSASQIAANFGLSQTLIGLTVVALGTSLPELVTSVVAAKKGESDLALGNVIGSNIFNLLMVLGLSCSLHPVAVVQESVVDLIFLIVSSIIVLLFARSSKQISKKESFIMIPLYLIYLAYIIVR